MTQALAPKTRPSTSSPPRSVSHAPTPPRFACAQMNAVDRNSLPRTPATFRRDERQPPRGGPLGAREAALAPSPPSRPASAVSPIRRDTMRSVMKNGLLAIGALALAGPAIAQGDNPNNGGAKISASLTG